MTGHKPHGREHLEAGPNQATVAKLCEHVGVWLKKYHDAD
jgi:hypothetical protein